MKKESGINTGKQNKMITSLDLVKEINSFREREGNRPYLQHCDLLKVIRDEFEEEIGLGAVSESSYINSQNKKQPMFVLTSSQTKRIFVRMKASPSPVFMQTYNIQQVDFKIISKSRFEYSFGKQLTCTLLPLKIEVIKQHYVKPYHIDFYIPKYNLAIEYDEMYHETSHQKTADNMRQEYIEQKLNCRFVRLTSQTDDATNVGIVLKNILNQQPLT